MTDILNAGYVYISCNTKPDNHFHSFTQNYVQNMCVHLGDFWSFYSIVSFFVLFVLHFRAQSVRIQAHGDINSVKRVSDTNNITEIICILTISVIAHQAKQSRWKKRKREEKRRKKNDDYRTTNTC